MAARPAAPDFASMPLDKIEEWCIATSAEIDEAHDRLRVAHTYAKQKREYATALAALAAAGVEGVTISPPPLEMGATGAEVS